MAGIYLHPFGFPIPPNSFGGLKQMFYLWNTRLKTVSWVVTLEESHTHVGIGLIYQGVEQLDSFPYAHASALTMHEVHPGFSVEGHGLLFCTQK